MTQCQMGGGGGGGGGNSSFKPTLTLHNPNTCSYQSLRTWPYFKVTEESVTTVYFPNLNST